MNKVIAGTGYQVTSLQEEHLPTAIDLFTKSFCTSEPITKHIGIQAAEFRPFATEVLRKAIKDGMTRVILDKNNRVIAFAVAEDIVDPFIPKLSHYPKMRPVFSLLAQLSAPFLEGKIFNKGKVAHVWVAVVDQAHRGHGLSTVIDMACGEMAARKGFDFAYAEFTNPISEKIIGQYKLAKLCNRISYSEFTMEQGIKPFYGVPGGASAYIVVIRPGVKLESLVNCYTTIK